MSRTSSTLALACMVIVASACAADRTTGPDITSALAAVAGADPSPLSAGPISNVAIGIGWTDNSPNENGFEVQRSTTGSTGAYTVVATTTANVTSYNDTPLSPATEYCYKVRAFRSQGGRNSYSAFSNAACATTYGPPAAPATVTASPREYGTVIVGWAASPSATSYRLERASGATGPWEVAANGLYALQYTDPGRPLEQMACYRVAAVNQWGDGISAPRCTAPPAPPANLAVTASSGSGLDVGWADQSSVEDGYEVQRATADYQFTTIGTTAANATSYHDGSALNDTRYWYRVRATKDGGYSIFSPWADGMKATIPPGAPSGVSAFPVTSSVIDVRWTASPGNVSGYRTERSVSGGAWTVLGTTQWNESQQIYDYAATAEVEGCYRVIAFNAAGDSPPSASDCARPLAAPTNVAATTAGSDAIDVTWNDASAFESGYVVERLACSNYYYYSGYYPYCYVAESATLPPGSTSWHSTGLAAGQSYDYQVYAIGTKNGQTYLSDVVGVSGSTLP